MTFFIGISLAVVVTLVPLQIFYWWVIRPAMLGMLKVRLWRLQDEIALTTHGLSSEQSDEQAVVSRFAGHSDLLLQHLDTIDVADVFKAADKDVLEQIEADLDVFVDGKAPCQVVVNAINILLAAVLINSPLFAPFFAVTYTAAIWLPKARERISRFRRDALAAAWRPMLPAT